MIFCVKGLMFFFAFAHEKQDFNQTEQWEGCQNEDFVLASFVQFEVNMPMQQF